VDEPNSISFDDDEVSPVEVYWAKRDARELVSTLQDKEIEFFDALKRRGFMRMWRYMWAQYYGQDPNAVGGFETQMITVAGEDGELLNFRLNEVRPLVRKQIQLVVGERPAFQCQAVNTDYATLGQVNICDSIIEYVYREAHAERQEWEVAESDSNYGAGFGWVRWDPDRGDEVEVTEQVPIPANPYAQPPIPEGATAPMPVMKRAGAPTVTVVHPWEMIQEASSKSHLWREIRERASKWELIATYPELAEKIRGLKGLDEWVTEALFGFNDAEDDSDELIVKHFYHERCVALPEGRYLGFVGDVVLWDTSCPVSKGLPIVEMCSERFEGTSFGYANGWELIASNQLSDQITSDMASNLATFGRTVIGVYDGTKFDVDALANGHRVLNIPAGASPPVPINFSGIPAAAQWALEYLNQGRARISGINEAAQGNPEAQVSSGSYLSLLHNIAIESQQPRQTAFDMYRERMANLMLDLVRQRASAPFLVSIAGLDERPYLRQFTADKLSGVKRVIVKTANPMMRSQAGRMDVFNAVKQIPNSNDRAAAIELVVSGNAKNFAKTERSEDMAIAWENEQLAQGIKVPIHKSDDPYKHWPKHKADLNARREELLSNPSALEAFNQHMEDHEIFFTQMLSPDVCALMGIQPSPTMQMQFQASAQMLQMQQQQAANTNQQAPEGAMASGQGTQAADEMQAGAPPPSDPGAAAGVDQPNLPQPAEPPGSQSEAA
jgi:hypothetical protein